MSYWPTPGNVQLWRWAKADRWCTRSLLLDCIVSSISMLSYCYLFLSSILIVHGQNLVDDGKILIGDKKPDFHLYWWVFCFLFCFLYFYFIFLSRTYIEQIIVTILPNDIEVTVREGQDLFLTCKIQGPSTTVTNCSWEMNGVVRRVTETTIENRQHHTKHYGKCRMAIVSHIAFLILNAILYAHKNVHYAYFDDGTACASAEGNAARYWPMDV